MAIFERYLVSPYKNVYLSYKIFNVKKAVEQNLNELC